MAAYHAEEAARAAANNEVQDEKLGRTPLFEFPTPPFDPDAYEREHRDRWIDELAKNISRLLHQHGAFPARRVHH